MREYVLPLDLQLFAGEGENAGVEEVPVAGEQTEEQPTEQPSIQEQTGVDGKSDVAGQIQDEKGFAAALKAREEQLRRQLEKEYAEKYKPLETQAQYLDRLAKFYGYTNHDEFIQAFEQAERDKIAREEAARLGIDEELYKKYLEPVNQKLSEYEKTIQELRQREMQRQIEYEIQQLQSKYPDFEQVKDKVFDIAIQKGYRLEDAYILATYEDRIAQLAKEKEQEVLAKVTGRDEKQVLSSTDKPSDFKFDPENMSLKDIEEISRRVQRGERITF